MSDNYGISYLPHREIDKKKWDHCIDTATNGRIYAYSFYLDMMAKNWDALVAHDYNMVMPLTWNRKYGISYLYQPFLTAQLGVFGNHISPKHVDRFIGQIPNSFKLIEIALNSNNEPAKDKKYITERNNYVLSLEAPYDEIRKKYNENTKRNIKKALQSGCEMIRSFDVENLIGLAISQMKSYGAESDDNVSRFRKIYHHLLKNNKTMTYGVKNEKGVIVSSGVFFFSHNRAYYILVGNAPESKDNGASHALIDAFIQDHADKQMILDFEGSDIPGLAAFYNGFGAVNESYPFLKMNRLPFYLRWLK